MTYFKIIRYIILILIILFILISSVYYIKPFKTVIKCPFDKITSNQNNFEWDIEDEIKKFTKLEDVYIKNKN